MNIPANGSLACTVAEPVTTILPPVNRENTGFRTQVEPVAARRIRYRRVAQDRLVGSSGLGIDAFEVAGDHGGRTEPGDAKAIYLVVRSCAVWELRHRRL